MTICTWTDDRDEVWGRAELISEVATYGPPRLSGHRSAMVPFK